MCILVKTLRNRLGNKFHYIPHVKTLRNKFHCSGPAYKKHALCAHYLKPGATILLLTEARVSRQWTLETNLKLKSDGKG